MHRSKLAAFRFLTLIILILTVLPVKAASGKEIDATTAGVVGNGTTLNTAAIQKAIDDCTATGGGVIRFPSGRYLTGTIQIKSNVTLRLEDQAVLLGSTDAADYRNLDPFTDGSGNPMGHALIVATDCKLSSRTNAIKLGTESIGGFDDISVSNCQVSNTSMAGIALYAVDGGDLQNVTISGVTMDGVAVPISIRLGSRLKTFREGERPRPGIGHLREVTIKDVTAKNIGLIGLLINGVPGHPVEALTLENIQLELPGGGTAADAAVQLAEKEATYPEFDMFGKTLSVYGICARHVRGMKLQNVRTSLPQPDARPETVFIDVENKTPANPTTGPIRLK
jgi:parallel beta-helix repeat protein